MLSIVASLAAAIVVTLIVGLPFGKIVYGIVPGIITFGVVWFLIGRRVMQDLQARMGRVQKMLTPKNPMKPTKPRIDDAVKILEGGYKWTRWSPFVEGQLAGQIGALYYLEKRFEEARPFLEKASPRNWVSKAMLGALYFKKKQREPMIQAFESAIKYSGKESLLWNTYAWCLYKQQDRDGAIEVLNRAVEKLGEEERTAKNLRAVQNSKGMKMKGWNEMWYQFHLEKPPQVSALPTKQFGKRALYRGR